MERLVLVFLLYYFKHFNLLNTCNFFLSSTLEQLIDSKSPSPKKILNKQISIMRYREMINYVNHLLDSTIDEMPLGKIESVF